MTIHSNFLSFVNGFKFPIESKQVTVRVSAQSTKYDGVVSNKKEPSMCLDDGTMKNMSVEHQMSIGMCLEQGKAQREDLLEQGSS